MPLDKHIIENLRQGYKATSNALADDIETLKAEYRTLKDSELDEGPDVIRRLILGSACHLQWNTQRKKLVQMVASDGKMGKALLKKIDKLNLLENAKVKLTQDDGETPEDHLNVGAAKVIMGPLKKVGRIMEKAVSYAACAKTESATLQLASVCDILRASIVFPASVFTDYEGIGALMIDAVNDTYGDKLVQVKNRFLEKRKPTLALYSKETFTKSTDQNNSQLVNDIADLVNNKIDGKDTFYRDMLLLVKIPVPNSFELDHIYLELQLVSDALYGAKTVKRPNEASGHQMYKKIRTVQEYCEYLYYRKLRKGTFLLPDVDSFYPGPPMKDFEDFIDSLAHMWELYTKAVPLYYKKLENAITDSNWYDKHPQAYDANNGN